MKICHGFTTWLYKKSIDGIHAYIRKDTRLIIIKSNTPKVAFDINERTMVSASWDYLRKANSDDH